MRKPGLLAIGLLALSCSDGDAPRAPLASAATASATYVPRHDWWFYQAQGLDLGTAWRAQDYVLGPGWNEAQAPLGYGEDYVVDIPFGSDPNHKPITVYFRKSFFVADPARVASLRLDAMYDDGFVAYVNGQEIARASMPTGTIGFQTLASGHEANNVYVGFDVSAAARPALQAGWNTLAVEVHQASASSSDLVFDASLVAVEQVLNPPSPGGIARASTWSYWDKGGLAGTTWTLGAFDESSWSAGPGPLGYGESYLATNVGFGPSATNKLITTYFRKKFTVADPAAVTAIIGEVMFDDGIVVYLNGTRIGRDSMPSGTITSTTLAFSHEANNAYTRYDWSAQKPLLVAGENTIAVEVHQASASSSDLVFDLALTLTTSAPPPLPTQIARGSLWRYHDRGQDLGSAWQALGYDDTTWGSGPGPLGYGEPYLATTVGFGPDATHKYPTTYFRKKFSVANPAFVTSLHGELMYDDGAVVYLNGHEIARPSMQSGPITSSTFTGYAHEANNSYEAFNWFAAIPYLVAGENVIAVEVHQVTPSSSDLVFDLALQVGSEEVCGLPGCPALAPPEGTTLYGVWVSPANEVWAVGESGFVGRRAPTGLWCWCRPAPADKTLIAVWGSSASDVWMVGLAGTVRHFVGTGFASVDTGTTARLTDVWGSAGNDVFVVGDAGTVRHFNGSAWSGINVDAEHTLEGIWGASASAVWAVGSRRVQVVPEGSGEEAEVFRLDPDRSSWTREAAFLMEFGASNFKGVSGTSASDVWAVGERFDAGSAESFAFAAHFDGTAWSNATGPNEVTAARDYFDVAAGAPGGTWITGGDDFGTMVRFDAGSWSAAESFTNLLFAIDARGSELWAVGMNGKVLRWNGSAWVIDRPSSPPFP
jgi:hypothetical protein